jgi:NAD-dependent SIR2 family protein deacetylase
MVGWQTVGRARPGPAHHALARLQSRGYLDLLVTQNVDRLHQRAGHRSVVDLHGRLDRVVCLECAACVGRDRLQPVLEALNPQLVGKSAIPGPDGDSDIPDALLHGFKVPQCGECGGALKPDVVFYGGTVSKTVVARVEQAVRAADRLLVVGSSLMVFSSYRFCRLANQLSKPVLIVNDGKTRADDIAGLKIAGDCGRVLTLLEQSLARGHAPA